MSITHKTANVSFEEQAAPRMYRYALLILELSPKSFFLICEYLDCRRSGVPAAEGGWNKVKKERKKKKDEKKKKTCSTQSHNSSDMLVFREMKAVILYQQAISLPSGGITHI